MRRAARWLPLLIVPIAASCLQKLDDAASSGSPIAPPAPEPTDRPTTHILPGPPPFGFSDDAGNIVTSDEPCDATRAQAMGMLDKYCGGCHGGRTPGERAGSPPFSFVLDVGKLTSTYTNNTMPPLLFVKPGDPEHSRVYLRIRKGEMPPAMPLGLARPTTSDVSVLHEWIANCIAKQGGAGAGGAGGATTGGNDTGTGGAGGASSGSTTTGTSSATTGTGGATSGTGGRGGAGGAPIGDGGASRVVPHQVTFYGWPDNGGADIAFPKVHAKAGGAGTYADPITFATDPDEWPPGTILYLPFLKRYIVMEDSCASCTTDWAARKYHLHVWVNSDDRVPMQVTACEMSLMRASVDVEVNPPADRPVATTPLFDPNTGACVSP